MAARTTTSCFSSVKKALVFLARNPKVFIPLLLYAVVAFPISAVKTVYIWPLTGQMARLITQMEHTTDPSSAEYAGLLEELRQQARELLLICTAIALAMLALAFVAKQMLASSGDDRYSLTELLREAVKYAKGPLIATAVVTMLQVTSIALLGAYLDNLSDALAVLLLLAAYAAFVWLGVAAMVVVAASVVDDVEVVVTLTGEGCCPGVRGLREAWPLVMQASRKEGYVLVTLLLPTVLGPLYAVALLYTKQSMGLGLCLLSAYDDILLTNVHDIYYFMVASVYCCQATKQLAAAWDDYAQIPSGEENI